ncbi:MAG: NosD domain-containing protein [Nanoarchaeota archaeon]
MKRVKIFLILLLLWLGGVVSAANYYVDVNSIGGACSDSNAGTSLTQPFCTTTRGVQAAMPGDLVYIREGVYYNPNSDGILPIRDGTAANPITFKGYPLDSKRPIIKGDISHSPVFVGGYSYLIFDSLELIEGRQGGVVIPGASTGIIIRNNDIHNNYIGSDLTDNTGGIVLYDFSVRTLIIIENNTIHDNEGRTLNNGNGIHMYPCVDCIIRYNHIYNASAGIFLKSAPLNGIQIYGNVIHDVDIGMHFYRDPTNIDVHDNLIYNFNSQGLGRMQQPGSSLATNLSYYHNTVIGIGQGIEYFEGQGLNTKIFNNVFYYGGTGGCDTAGTYARTFNNRGTDAITNFQENNNLFYHPTDSWYFCWNGLIYDLAGWRNYWQTQSSNNGQYSIGSNPLFYNPNNYDYHLQSISPGIDAGTFIPGFHCALSDSNGGTSLTNCRHWSGLAPDIGAYEFVSGATFNSPDVNSDGKVNVIDLVLVIRWQGRNSGNVDWNNYRHLDVNNDNVTSMLDVNAVMVNM